VVGVTYFNRSAHVTLGMNATYPYDIVIITRHVNGTGHGNDTYEYSRPPKVTCPRFKRREAMEKYCLGSPLRWFSILPGDALELHCDMGPT